MPRTVATSAAGIATVIEVTSASLSGWTDAISRHHSSVQQVNCAVCRTLSPAVDKTLKL